MLQDGEKGVIIQRDKSYAIAPHVPCGVIDSDTIRKLADVADKFNANLKITSAARVAVIGLSEEEVDLAWEMLGMDKGAATGLCIRSIKACPGTTYCKRGMLDSLSLGLELDKKYHGLEVPGKIKMGVSGCPNQCAETCIKDIGIVANKKGWKIFVGGKGGGKARLSELLIENLDDSQVMEWTDKIINLFKEKGDKNQRIGPFIDSLGGMDKFKKILGINN